MSQKRNKIQVAVIIMLVVVIAGLLCALSYTRRPIPLSGTFATKEQGPTEIRYLVFDRQGEVTYGTPSGPVARGQYETDEWRVTLDLDGATLYGVYDRGVLYCPTEAGESPLRFERVSAVPTYVGGK